MSKSSTQPKQPTRRFLTVVEREERDVQQRPLNFATIKRLYGFSNPYARIRWRLVCLVVLRAIQLPLLAWALFAVIAGPVKRLDMAGTIWGSLGYLALAAITQLTMVYRLKYSQELGENVVCDMRQLMFSHLQSLPMAYFHRTSVGRVISRFVSDAEAVRAGVQDTFFVGIVGGGQMIVASIFMLYYDWTLFLVIAGMLPVLWIMNRMVHKRLVLAYRSVQESFSRVTATLAESVSGIRVTQGFSREGVNAGLFADLVKDHSRYNIDAARVAGIFLPMLEFNTQFFISLVLLIGGFRVFDGTGSVENLFLFVFMSNIFFQPLQFLGQQYNQALTAMAGAERVFHMLDTKPEWTDPTDAVTLPEMRGDVVFEHVQFSYLPDRPVLRDVSFIARAGQTIAFVGHTGSGKTSIINLISKFYLPDSGRILIDGTPIQEIQSESLHRHIGIVLQVNFLFTGTVMENIRYGRPDATDEQVRNAVRELDCLDLIESLPQGFDTVVGERGVGISSGQRQLICFARSLLVDPRILILDEATSAVDTLTESRLQQALARLLKHRTSFVVAHRLSTIRHADRVIVLEQGRIIESGSHDELVAANSTYARLYEQFVHATTA